MKKYIAHITIDSQDVEYEIEGWGKTPQDFHKIVMFQHINYPTEDILYITNDDNKKVFKLNKGFCGT